MPRLDWIEFETMMDAHDGARDRVPGTLDAAILWPLLASCAGAAAVRGRRIDAAQQRNERRRVAA